MCKDNSFEELLERIGARVRKLRKQNGLTQEELAGRVGVTKGHISHIEIASIDNYGFGLLCRIADELHTSVTFLFTGSDKAEEKAIAQKDPFEDLEGVKEKSKRKYRRALHILKVELSDKETLEEKRVKLAEMVINLVEFCD